MLAIHKLTKIYPGPVQALTDVDLEVDRGMFGLLGPNGAGKSSLMRTIATLQEPDEGRILRAGTPVRLRSPREGLQHGIGMVHQHFRLVDRFTVAENVVLGDPDQSSIINQREIEARVGELGDQFGLPVEPRARISDLAVGSSSGQR